MIPHCGLQCGNRNSGDSKRPGTGVGELDKYRFWPSDFLELSKLWVDEKEGEKKRPKRNE